MERAIAAIAATDAAVGAGVGQLDPEGPAARQAAAPLTGGEGQHDGAAHDQEERGDRLDRRV